MQSAVIGSTEFVYGICEIQNLVVPNPQTEPATFAPAGFGNVKTAKLGRKADQEQIEDCNGDLRALLLRNPRYELQLSIVVKKTLVLAELGSRLSFPIANMYGNILDWDLGWQSKGLKSLDMNASRWDSLGDSPTVTVVDDD